MRSNSLQNASDTQHILTQTDRLLYDMSQDPDDALKGIEVTIRGSHTFTVGDQEKVVAKGKTIMVFPPQQSKASWAGQDTGSDGMPVSKDMTVFVNDVKVVFH